MVIRNRLLIIFVLIISLVSCDKKDLVDTLSQKQAVNIVNSLNQNNITAQVVKSNISRKGYNYKVVVDDKNYLNSIAILDDLNILNNKSLEFGELTRTKSFSTNNKNIDAIKLDRALSIEIEELLSDFEDIISTQVVVRSNLINKKNKPKITIHFLTNKDFVLSEVETELRKIVNNSLPEVKDEDIYMFSSVKNQISKTTIKESPLVKFLVWEVPEKAGRQIGILILITSFLVAFCSFFLGFFVKTKKITNLQVEGKKTNKVKYLSNNK